MREGELMFHHPIVAFRSHETCSPMFSLQHSAGKQLFAIKSMTHLNFDIAIVSLSLVLPRESSSR